MDRPGLNKSFRMASVLKHGSRKRVRTEEDDFDMVLANETPKVVTMAKLEPILLEEIRKGLLIKRSVRYLSKHFFYNRVLHQN